MNKSLNLKQKELLVAYNIVKEDANVEAMTVYEWAYLKLGGKTVLASPADYIAGVTNICNVLYSYILWCRYGKPKNLEKFHTTLLDNSKQLGLTQTITIENDTVCFTDGSTTIKLSRIPILKSMLNRELLSDIMLLVANNQLSSKTNIFTAQSVLDIVSYGVSVIYKYLL